MTMDDGTLQKQSRCVETDQAVVQSLIRSLSVRESFKIWRKLRGHLQKKMPLNVGGFVFLQVGNILSELCTAAR